jgi:hypothetical protein
MGWALCTYCRHEWCLQSFGGETWGKIALERLRYRWECNITMEIEEVE